MGLGAVFANLKTALEAADELDGVQISSGPPEAYEAQEVIAILGVGPDTVDTAGYDLEAEESLLRLRVKVDNPAASDGEEVSTRMWALVDGIDAALDADRRLAGAVMKVRLAGARSDGPLPALDQPGGNQQGWIQFADVDLVALGLF